MTSVTDITDSSIDDLEGKRQRQTNAPSVATFGVTMKFEWDAAKNQTNIRKQASISRMLKSCFAGWFWHIQTFGMTMEKIGGLLLDSFGDALCRLSSWSIL